MTLTRRQQDAQRLLDLLMTLLVLALIAAVFGVVAVLTSPTSGGCP